MELIWAHPFLHWLKAAETVKFGIEVYARIKQTIHLFANIRTDMFKKKRRFWVLKNELNLGDEIKKIYIIYISGNVKFAT